MNNATSLLSTFSLTNKNMSGAYSVIGFETFDTMSGSENVRGVYDDSAAVFQLSLPRDFPSIRRLAVDNSGLTFSAKFCARGVESSTLSVEWVWS